MEIGLIKRYCEQIDKLEALQSEMETCTEGAKEIVAEFQRIGLDLATELKRLDLDQYKRVNNTDLGQN